MNLELDGKVVTTTADGDILRSSLDAHGRLKKIDKLVFDKDGTDFSTLDVDSASKCTDVIQSCTGRNDRIKRGLRAQSHI